MKKIIVALLTVAMVFALASCKAEPAQSNELTHAEYREWLKIDTLAEQFYYSFAYEEMDKEAKEGTLNLNEYAAGVKSVLYPIITASENLPEDFAAPKSYDDLEISGTVKYTIVDTAPKGLDVDRTTTADVDLTVKGTLEYSDLDYSTKTTEFATNVKMKIEQFGGVSNINRFKVTDIKIDGKSYSDCLFEIDYKNSTRTITYKGHSYTDRYLIY